MAFAVNKLILHRIEQLLLEHREKYRIDLHLHTSYSSDGIQTVFQAIDQARKQHLDIISITDHDTIGAYNEIIENNLLTDTELPIILPGVEFTVSFPEYHGRCHVLKYLYDVNDTNFIYNLQQNKDAFNQRVKLWFECISKNLCLQYFFSRYGIHCSEEQYRIYLNKQGNPTPDYANLMGYIFSLLQPYGIGVWDIYNKVVEININDSCSRRRLDMNVALTRFWGKYGDKDINSNYRKLRPLLAPLGIVDANYPEYEPIGSISIEEFGQVHMDALANSGINILAHPNSDKLYLMEQLFDVIHGLELNAHSDKETNQKVKSFAEERSLIVTRGSDKHVDTDEYYSQMEFYDIQYNELQMLYYLLMQAIGTS